MPKHKKLITLRVVFLLSFFLLPQLVFANWNSPYSGETSEEMVLYSSFAQRPKHLDPIRSYSSDEMVFSQQIYESPLQYHFLHRPYRLEPLILTSMPEVIYRDDQNNIISGDDPEKVAYSDYVLRLKKGIRYQPHPALAKDEQGNYVYHTLSEQQISEYKTLADFPEVGSRELLAMDIAYQIKRFAHPRLHSPLSGLMQEHIVGMETLTENLQVQSKINIDLRDHVLSGVTVNGDYELTIRVNKIYPQFMYWLAMPFFAPMPWEVEAFYGQAGMADNNLNLDWYPIGTGPYMLAENNPNLRMVLVRNPNFRETYYPSSGTEQDNANGMLDDAGKRIPFIDKAIYSLEKESMPSWAKFLQGYYDRSGISSDSFDQVISFDGGNMDLSADMKEKGISLDTVTQTVLYYVGFNMLDETVGGDSEPARLLRQAISIALDYEEYIDIFSNGRGEAAQGPIPPGIFGYQEGKAGLNPYVYDWVNGQAQRKPIEQAKQLLEKAGYANGIDQKTGKPLILYFDSSDNSVDGKARLNWLRKQFSKIDIQLVIRSSDYNRFQEKVDAGETQLFFWGWHADYPDPENFLFLMYGPNGKVATGGPNHTNFSNPEFDQLFDVMKNMPNGPERLKVVNQMVEIARRESAWVFAFFPKKFTLSHRWYKNRKQNLMGYGTLKYRRLEPELRQQSRTDWNHPKLWPLLLIALLLIAILIPAYRAYRQSEQRTGLG